MRSVDLPTKKRCPKCKEVDNTTFSKCKNCGTRYDATYHEEKHRRIDLALPLVLTVAFIFAAYFAYQYGFVLKAQDTYKHLDRMIGKSLNCESDFVVVSLSPDSLRSLDAELAVAQKNDPKRYGSKGLAGIMSAASALNSISSGKEDSSAVIGRYMEGGRVDYAYTNNEAPLSVSLVAVTPSSDKYPLVQVKMLNGNRAGSLWWINADQLDLQSAPK